MGRYPVFSERNPTPEQRMVCLLRLLKPDPRAVALYLMEPGRGCDTTTLCYRANRFTGEEFPLEPLSLEYHFGGNFSGAGGFLSEEGFVHRVESEDSHVYEKTGFGIEVGDPVVALGLNVFGRLRCNEKSALRLIGRAGPPAKNGKGREYVFYRVVKQLATNPKTSYREADFGDLPVHTLTHVLNNLGMGGAIDFESPQSSLGMNAAGWAKYRVAPQRWILRSGEEAIDRRLRPFAGRIRAFSYAMEIVRYIQDHPEESFSHVSLSGHVLQHLVKGSRGAHISKILSALRDAGYLNSYFGPYTRTRARANQDTMRLWQLLEPLEAFAHTLDPKSNPGLEKPHARFSIKPGEKRRVISSFLKNYQKGSK